MKIVWVFFKDVAFMLLPKSTTTDIVVQKPNTIVLWQIETATSNLDDELFSPLLPPGFNNK